MVMKNYRLTLTTKGPVHIGNGDRSGKKDYFRHNGRIAVLDVPSFISCLNERQLKEYCDFLETKSALNLEDFLRNDKSLRFAAEKSIQYCLDMGFPARPIDVQSFVKDFEGQPYIPGSSVKGMLRTALLTNLILESDRKKLESIYWECPNIASNIIEGRLLRNSLSGSSVTNDATSDIMRFISISDSDSLSLDSLVFVKQYDEFAKTDGGWHKPNIGRRIDRSGNELNIYRECLRPGTAINFVLNIDDRINEYIPIVSLDVDRLLSLFERQNSLYRERYLDKFDMSFDTTDDHRIHTVDNKPKRCCYVIQDGPFMGQQCRNRAVDGTDYCNKHKDKAVEKRANSKSVTCYLGGGIGFNSKTIAAALFKDENRYLKAVSQELYSQFPTKLDTSASFFHNKELSHQVNKAGFKPKQFQAIYSKGRLRKAKNDPRHWEDAELGVAPHTLKLGIFDGKKYLMGKCELRIEEQR